MKYDITHAMQSLASGKQWVIRGDDYSGLEWLSDGTPPTEEELLIEIERLQSEYDAMDYSRSRANEYPDFKDYLDGIVKGDQDQIDAYIAECLAVKEKYPKPS